MFNRKVCFALVTLSLTACHIIYAADTNDALALKELGNKCYHQQQYDDAIKYYSDALNIEPTKVLYRNRGMAYFKKEECLKAKIDFSQALELDPFDSKTLYWVGMTQATIVQANYYLKEAILSGPQDKLAENQLTRNNETFSTLLKEDSLSSERESDVDRELRGLQAADRVCCKYGLVKHCMLHLVMKNNLLNGLTFTYSEEHWILKEFTPLNRKELPEKLAEFIGEGKHVATVVVQTLPILLSNKFKTVSVYDISLPQLEFHKSLVEAINHKELEKFISNAKTDFKKFIEETPLPEDELDDEGDPVTDANRAFDGIYAPLYKMLEPLSIAAKNIDIFKAITDEDKNNPHDTIFLSTIPYLDRDSWATTIYPKIREWVAGGKTVVYTLDTDCFITEILEKEFMTSFDDVAITTFAMFEESVTFIHVRLTPKPKKG